MLSAREWKPGDVAMVTLFGEGSRVGIKDTHGWAIVNHVGDRAYSRWHNGSLVQDARPLVVIDPEDREQVARLADFFRRLPDPLMNTIASMQAALRSLIEPQRPDEPTGLGAVVEGADGLVWVHRGQQYFTPWVLSDRSGIGGSKNYSEIDAVKVLSEGIS